MMLIEISEKLSDDEKADVLIEISNRVREGYNVMGALDYSVMHLENVISVKMYEILKKTF